MFRRQFLYQLLVASFSVIVVLSNILSVKLVKLPWLLPSVPAGLITYPLTFLLSDLVTEIFGARRAKAMVYIALSMSLLSFALIQWGLILPSEQREMQSAFHTVLGLTGVRVFSSLIAYVTAQMVDIHLYAAIKRRTGMKWLWLRNNASTCVSQLVDTVMIDLLFLWWGLSMPMTEVFPILIFSYVYKTFFSAACTPLFYALVFLIRGKKEWKQRGITHV